MTDDTLIGILLDEQEVIPLTEVASICACRVDWIVELVEEGVIEPENSGVEPSEWRFTGSSLVRARTAVRLQRDLDLNLAGVALAIDLLEEISELQARLNVLKP